MDINKKEQEDKVKQQFDHLASFKDDAEVGSHVLQRSHEIVLNLMNEGFPVPKIFSGYDGSVNLRWKTLDCGAAIYGKHVVIFSNSKLGPIRSFPIDEAETTLTSVLRELMDKKKYLYLFFLFLSLFSFLSLYFLFI